MKQIFAVVTSLLFLFVMSNDYHQMVFAFQMGYSEWYSDYTYGWGYVVVVAWICFLYALSVVFMFKKCKLAKVKKKWWVITIPFILGIIMLLLIACGKMPKINNLMVINFPEAVCFMIALFWECCIRIGLIPTNKGYGELMKVCSLALQITDKNGKQIYQSLSANELLDTYKEKAVPILIDKDTELYREPIPGGYVYWQNDISELNEINKKLEEIRSLLAEETELIRLENELKERQVSIEQRTRMYEQIHAKTITQSRHIACLADKALGECDIENRNYDAGIICFLGAYMKRYANFMLMAEHEEQVNVTELGMAIAESLRYLSNVNIPGAYVGSGDARIFIGDAILIYEIFQELIENNLPNLQGVYANLEDTTGIVLKITLEGVRVVLDEQRKETLFQAGIPVTVHHEDDISYVRFRLVKEG